MYSKKINQLATNLNPQSTDLLPIGDAETGQLKTTTFNQISGVTGDGVISGGIVTWTGTGLIFNISACTYYLNGIRYTSPFSTKTLAAADPTNPRIDVFAVNTSSQVEVIQGTPNANPVEPEGDTATTLGLTNVTIAAGATTPSNVTRDLIYDENVETWTKTFTQSQATVDYANTLFPNTGSKSILVTMGSGFINLNFSKAVALDISNYKSLSFAIRLTNALTSNTILGVRFQNGSNNVSNLFQIGTSNNVGFNRNLAGSYQIITIPFNNTNLRFTSNAFTTIRISTQNAPATYRLDTIQLNGGINNPGGGTTTPSNSFGFVNATTGTASSTTATDTLNVVGTGLATTSATGKTLTISVPDPIPSQTGNNGKYLTTNGSVLSWGTVTGSMAIGGSITSATAGSVLFAGTSGVLQQDNANFFWDDSNNRLGIGTNTPASPIHINATAVTSIRESLLKATVSDDANSAFYINNATSTDGLFAPSFGGFNNTQTQYSLNFRGFTSTTNDASDSSTFGLVHIDCFRTSTPTDPYNGTLSAVQNRKIFTLSNQNEIYLTVAANGNTTVNKNQNGTTILNVSNTTGGTASKVTLRATSDIGNFELSKFSSTSTAYKIMAAGDGFLYNQTTGDIAIHNDVSFGKIKFAAGGSSTAQMTLTAAGRLLLGTTTESTFLLDVNGTARLNGSTTFGTLGAGTGMFWDNTNNRLGIGTSAPSKSLDVRGSINITATSVASTRENLLTAYVSDNATDVFGIANGTTTDARFSPSLYQFSDGSYAALSFRGLTSTSGDTGSTPMIILQSARTSSTSDPNNGTFSSITTRPLLALLNNNTIYLQTFANGNIAINSTTDSGFKLDVNGTARISGNSTFGALITIVSSSPSLSFNTSGTLRSYISAAGGPDEWIIGSAIGDAMFRVENKRLLFSTNAGTSINAAILASGELIAGGATDNGAYNLQCNGTGVWGAGAYVNGSDIILKENIKSIESALNYVCQMNPVSFNYIESYSKNRSKQTGFIAQELQEVFKDEDWVDGIVIKDENHLNVAYQNIIPILTKAIQELKQEIELLKNK